MSKPEPRFFVPERPIRIMSTGAYLPPRVVTNADLVSMGATVSADEMERMCGVRERRYVESDQATSDLAIAACERALGGRDRSAIDRLVLATVSPDHMTPAAACTVQHALSLGHTPAHDLTASCAGFIYALDLAARCVATGDRQALACAADVRSRFVNLHDRSTVALFGDGATAALVGTGSPNFLGTALLAEGSGARAVYVPAGGSRLPATAETVRERAHTIVMADGPQVYLTAVDGMIAIGEALLERLGLSLSDIAMVVPHQPNRRILERMARLMRFPLERMWINVERTGNVSGASCGIALDEALRSGKLAPDSLVLMIAGGAGYTAGAAVLRVDRELLEAARP
jgi:3-oxoacyl-[acyl-carrier-protein] synthase-3